MPADGAGNFLPAMVLTNVDHSMLVMREETFGPVVAVMKVDEHGRSRRAGERQYRTDCPALCGHATGRAARRLAERLQAGAVMINDHLMSHGLAETPWGGFKQSSIGRSHGAIGFAEMTQPQCIIDDLLPGVRKNLWWHPHDRDVYRTMTSVIDMLYARRGPRASSGCWRLLKSLPGVFRP